MGIPGWWGWDMAANLVCRAASQCWALAGCSLAESSGFRDIQLSPVDLEAIQKALCFSPKAKQPKGTEDGEDRC